MPGTTLADAKPAGTAEGSRTKHYSST
jgi:hypothetical protein